MALEIFEELVVHAPPDDVFALVASVEGMRLFEGYGMIPGIARVEPSTAARGVGTEDVVHNTDGTTHPERVVEHEPPRIYAVAIGPFEPPFGRLVRGIAERWELDEEGAATRVRRRFTFTPRGGVGALVLKLIVLPQFRRAVRRNHLALKVALEG